MISLTPSNVQVLRPVDIQSYVGLRPMLARRSFCTMSAAKVPDLMVIRASNEQEMSVKSSRLSLEECEANAVAGNFPEPPPPYRPLGPKGTPSVEPLVCVIYIVEFIVNVEYTFEALLVGLV